MKYSFFPGCAAVLLVGLLATACTDDFEELNANPNQPEEVTSDLLLTNIIYEAVREMDGMAWGEGNVIAQYVAKIQFTGRDRYDWGPESDPWFEFYDLLRDVENIQAIEEEDNGYVAVSLIMKSWMYQILTDLYGDIPYSQAIQGKTEGNFTPTFDRQEVVYAGILADLERANGLLTTNPTPVVGDVLFDGDLERWQKLANSLRLRVLLRQSNQVDPSAAMEAILNDPNAPIFTSNDDQAVFNYLASAPNQQPLYTTRSGSFDEYRLSKLLENTLKGLNDNRLHVYAQPTSDAEAGLVGEEEAYQGVPNGLADESALVFNGGSNFVSQVGLLYACLVCDDNASPTARQGMVMTYAELQFILAEAAERGFIEGEAETFYRNGIQASYDYFQERSALISPEVSEAAAPAEGYYTQEAVAYTGSTEERLAKIGTQKWLALFFNGTEAWADWRRTGHPAGLEAGTDALIDKVPVRFMYPVEAQSLNGENYRAALSAQGPDNITTAVWWDVQ
ncbi:MAG: SusD/RagB family nutrient-binding outer membrane lipoprotein [Tunicatimonas sp.]